MKGPKRSACPISFSLEVLGDRWTLLVLRDLVFFDRRYFQEFLESREGIASNVLSERLDRLERHGIVSKQQDPRDRRRNVYSLTPRGLDLVPILVELTIWGATHDPGSEYPRERLAWFQEDRDRAVRHVRERAAVAADPESRRPDPAA